MNTTNTFTLQPWQKREATLLYHYTSEAYFREYFERLNRAIAFADKTLDEAALQQRDKFLTSERWGVRDTAANWSTHAFPALMQLRQYAIELMAERKGETYSGTGYSHCVRTLREYSMFWSSPEEEEQFDDLFSAAGEWAGSIDQTCGLRNSAVGSNILFSDWERLKPQFPRLPKFVVHTDIEGISGEVPPRTGVYVPQDDPYGTLQFAWTGKKAYTSGGETYLRARGALMDCQTSNDIGIEALRHFGWEKFWRGAPQEMLDFVKARHMGAFEQWLKTPNPQYEIPFEPQMLNDPKEANYFLLASSLKRPCKWYYVEQIEGEYEDPEPEVTPRSLRLRGEPGEAVPQSGWWHTLALKGEEGFRRFEQGQRFPDTKLTEWGQVIWSFDPEHQPKA